MHIHYKISPSTSNIKKKRGNTSTSIFTIIGLTSMLIQAVMPKVHILIRTSDIGKKDKENVFLRGCDCVQHKWMMENFPLSAAMAIHRL